MRGALLMDILDLAFVEGHLRRLAGPSFRSCGGGILCANRGLAQSAQASPQLLLVKFASSMIIAGAPNPLAVSLQGQNRVVGAPFCELSLLRDGRLVVTLQMGFPHSRCRISLSNLEESPCQALSGQLGHESGID